MCSLRIKHLFIFSSIHFLIFIYQTVKIPLKSSKSPIFAIMKRLTLWLCSCVAAVTMFNSCSNDFDLVDTWQDIPIIYGLLNVNDTAQYVKVEKAFLDANTSALLIAQEPDSLYYDNISVELEEINENGAVEFSFPLNLIDANLDGYEKPEGIFADTPNYVYKTTEILNPERRYNLVVTNGETDKTITLQEKNGERSIGLIGDFTLTRPNPTGFFNFEPGRGSEFKWVSIDESGERNAKFYDVILYINYYEMEVNNPATRTEKTLEWVIRQNMTAIAANSQEFEVPGEDFYRYLGQQLESYPLICRELNDFDIVIYAGGDDLYQYINRQAANAGITGTQGFSDYTNLSDGLGVLSTRYNKRVDSLQFNSDVNDQLLINEFTSDLNFLEFGDTCN